MNNTSRASSRFLSKRNPFKTSGKLQRAMIRMELLDPRVMLTGTVNATVINDLNGNGAINAGEAGLTGVTVWVDTTRNGTRDAGEPFAVSDSSGLAHVVNVPVGTFDIRETVPSGFTTAKDFDRQRVGDGDTVAVSFFNAPTTSTKGTAQGTVWNDLNGDGVHDAADPGLANWTVYVDLNGNRAFDASDLSDVTDANGFYSISGITPGKYKVRDITPAGWDATVGADGANNVTIVAGGIATSDFGNFNTAALGAIVGGVWNDVNADGSRAASDVGLGNWSLFIDLNNDGAQGAGEPLALTDAGGNYAFNSIAIGTYTVKLVQQSGWSVSPGFAIARTVSVINEHNGRADFAVFTPTLGSTSGTVFNDVNGDGFDTGEAGISGWTVFIDQDSDGVVDATEPSTLTDASGNYLLNDVPIGSNLVREIPASGFTPTAPGTGMQLVNVLNATSVTSINFGNKQRTDGTISGLAFNDANKNGTRDAGETGLSGINIYIDLNNDGDRDAGEPVATTSTDLFYTPTINEAGTYAFTHLAAGTYHVRQIVPDLLSATPAAQHIANFDLGVGEQRTSTNFADVYRSNEIHGVIFNDLNNNHVRDAGEPGIQGVVVYLDLNRDNVWQSTEPKTATAADGSYGFTTNLAPGSYVVRRMHHSGTDDTYPTTTSGILWPAGVSNPAIGNVSPTSITTSLADGQKEHDSVSLTLPGSGALTDKVDVFLLFDDTGSFTANSPIVRAAFPQIIAQLQAALPGIDLGFGVGRFEEYANFASEFATGRPFILNQPIISQATPGFSASIQAALDRTAPGYGGDQPETDIEALYQTVTGAGFDGNDNGTTTDSGPAGATVTQISPGPSGDVPAFGSFTVDLGGNVLPSDGNIGGAGFRPGALPIILTATDTGFAFQPQGETSIHGLNGLTLPISALTQTSRSTTPFNSGAGIQQTVDALNALGALVIGLGTNPEATLDPRQDLEALAKLTGATNRSLTTIDNGTADPIAPGDPLYFEIASGFGASVANGVVSAISNGVSNISVNLTVQASDPRVHVTASPGVINNLTSGQTATFDVEFEGDGRPHRFDLQFVREGTNVVLGSIPVVMGTPINGDGYEYEDLDDGEIENESDFGEHENSTEPHNSAPSFSITGDQTVQQDPGAQLVPGFATNLSAGPASDAGQVLDFIVSNDSGGMFDVAPAIASDGTLTYTPKPGASGSALITVSLHDSGGTFGGGEDTSTPQTFRIDVSSATLAITSRFDMLAGQAIVIGFNQNVASSLTVDDLILANLTGNQPIVISDFAYDADSRQATLSFAPGALADGNYRLTIAQSALPNMTAAHTLNFYVLAGDANRDRHVDALDQAILTANLGNAAPNFASGDFNYDGTVDANDQAILDEYLNVWLSQQGAVALPATSGDDDYVLQRESPELLDVYANGASSPTYRILTGAFRDAQLTFDGGTGSDSIAIVGSSGADAVSFSAGGIAMNDISIAVANNEAAAFNGEGGFDTLAVNGGPSVSMNGAQHLASLSVTNNAAAKMGHALLMTKSLSIESGSTLDLSDGDMIVDYDDLSQLAALQSLINAARASAAWTGNGLTSSAAKLSTKMNTTLGAMEASDYKSLNAANTKFDGETIDNTAVLVKYTYYGDANFNGKIDGGDYARIDLGFGQHRTGWTNGDFNADGKINGSDYGLLDFSFSTQSGSLNLPATPGAGPTGSRR